MKTTNQNFFKNCLNIKHVLAFLILSNLAAFNAEALDASQLNPLAEMNDARTPANFVPSDDVGFIPLVQEIELLSTERLQDDKYGTLKNMRNRLVYWHNQREYAETWGLDSTGLYDIADDEDKFKLVNKGFLKFAEKRLNAAMKTAKPGSTFATMRNVESALKPDTTMKVSKRFKFRVSAKVLQGKGIAKLQGKGERIELHLSAGGNCDIKFINEFEAQKVRTDVTFDLDEGRYVASVDKRITDHLSVRAIADHDFGSGMFIPDTTYQVSYGMSF